MRCTNIFGGDWRTHSLNCTCRSYSTGCKLWYDTDNSQKDGIGPTDDKHVHIIPLENFVTYYCNYKGKCRQVLLVIVDAKHRFLLVDFGANKWISDGGVLQNTSFFAKLMNNDLHIPGVF